MTKILEEKDLKDSNFDGNNDFEFLDIDFQSDGKKEEVSWTPEQSEAIDISEEKNLLVSASAGSGKTAVMTQRIINLVTQKKVPISNFLIVTFTSASAQDMKSKIIKKFQSLPADPFILEQIDAISTSDISDLHSFYSRLISTYFYELDIDPAYHIIDDVESSYLKDNAISKLFEQKEKEGNKEYFLLFDIFQDKRKDEKLRNAILSLNDLLDSQIDGEKWFFDNLEMTYSEDFENSVCIKIILDYVSETTKLIAEKIDKVANRSLEFGLEKYYAYFVDFESKVKAFSNKKSYIQNANISKEFVFLNIPKKTNKDDELSEEVQTFIAQAKEFNTNTKEEIKELQKFFKFESEDQVKERLRQSKEILKSLFNLTKEYTKIYTDFKHERNGLDFNDLEKYAYKILSNENICLAVKSKYKYIFVDEYQDINNIQEKIISMISSENNRFMVGDLKQSIYRFRLCDPEIFLDKYKTYSLKTENCKVVKLNKNFRSDKKILKFVDKIFSKTMTDDFGGIDYEKESQFTAGDKNLDLPHSSTICFIDTEKDKQKVFAENKVYSVKNHTQNDDVETKSIIAEAKYVSQKIAEIILENKFSPDAVSYSDFAVLVYSRGMQISKFIDTLKSFNIPVSSDEKIDLTESLVVQEILNFTKFVNNGRDDFLLFKVLKSRMFNFSDRELVELRNINKRVRFYDTINFYEFIEGDELKFKIKEFFKIVEKYSKLSKMMQIKDFAKLLIKDFKFEKLNLLDENGENENEIMMKFISCLPSVSVNEFLIDFTKFAVKIQNECGGDAVKVMTIHRSKGLEFKYVFLINNGRKIKFDSINGKILFNKNFGLGLKSFDIKNRLEYSNPAIDAIRIFEKKKIAEEQQRVLYVALTRAVQKLFVICSLNGKDITSEFPVIPKKYTDWFSPLIFELKNGKKFDYVDFEEYALSDFSSENKIETRELNFVDGDEKKPNEFVYTFNSSIGVPLKNSVSKILSSKGFDTALKKFEKSLNLEDENEFFGLENSEKETLNNNKNDLNVVFEDDIDDEFEYQELKAQNEDLNFYASRGTAYHKVLQNIDICNISNIETELENLSKIYEDEFKLVEKEKIINILKHPFFHNLDGYKILKEQEFFAKVNANLLKEDVGEDDYIMMQGVIDFMAIGEDEIYILDYKTGRKTDEKLKKYKFQLDMYADIAQKIFNKKVTKKIICFIDEQNIIEI